MVDRKLLIINFKFEGCIALRVVKCLQLSMGEICNFTRNQIMLCVSRVARYLQPSMAEMCNVTLNELTLCTQKN